MGQKVNPIGMRLQVNRTWDSRWFADSKDYGNLLLEDVKIREFIHEEAKQAGVSRVIIERPHKKCRVTIHAARPGVIIGRKGADIETLRKKLANFTDSELHLNIVEVRKPELDAALVGDARGHVADRAEPEDEQREGEPVRDDAAAQVDQARRQGQGQRQEGGQHRAGEEGGAPSGRVGSFTSSSRRGRSLRDLRPNCSRKRGVVPQRLGRPGTSLRPRGAISAISSRASSVDCDRLAPRISSISARVTGWW